MEEEGRFSDENQDQAKKSKKSKNKHEKKTTVSSQPFFLTLEITIKSRLHILIDK